MDGLWTCLLQNSLQTQPDFLALQEVPRQAPGWARAVTKDRYCLISHRHPEAWRGLAVVYRTDLFELVSKSCTHHCMWTVFQARHNGARLALGCCHIDSNISVQEYEYQLTEVLTSRPMHQGKAFLLGDFNADLCWKWGEDLTPGKGVSLPPTLGGAAAKCSCCRI